MKVVKRWNKMMPETFNQYECCCCDEVVRRRETATNTSATATAIRVIGNYQSEVLSFDDKLCEDVLVIICSFLGAEELWNNTRRVNMSFRNQTMKDRLWRELYHLRWGRQEVSINIYHQEIKEDIPWWKVYMQRHKWLSFELNSMEVNCSKLNNQFNSVNCQESELAFYERLHSLGQVASECGLCLISQKEQSKNNKPITKVATPHTYPHTIPKSNIEECVIFCKLFLKNYYGKPEVSGSRFSSVLLHLQVIFLLVQCYSIIGEYDKIIAFSSECLDCIQNLKQQFTAEISTSEDHLMCKIKEKCIFYRGYSSHKLGLYLQAEKDLELAESLNLVSVKSQEDCSSPTEDTTHHSRKHYHLMNIQFTLINNHIKLKQYQQSMNYFLKLSSLVMCSSNEKETTTIQSIDDKCWNLLNLWFPGLPYFFLAEYLYKQQDYSASKVLFEKYTDYEQGRKFSVHNKQKQAATVQSNSSKKQLVHAMNRIRQINSVIQCDQEY